MSVAQSWRAAGEIESGRAKSAQSGGGDSTSRALSSKSMAHQDFPNGSRMCPLSSIFSDNAFRKGEYVCMCNILLYQANGGRAKRHVWDGVEDGGAQL